MNLVAADVSPLHLLLGKVRADSRRLLQFRGSTREVTFRGKLSSLSRRPSPLILLPSDGRGAFEAERETGIRTWSRKRNPNRWSSERTRFSGVVFLPRMRLMFQERRSRERRSLPWPLQFRISDFGLRVRRSLFTGVFYHGSTRMHTDVPLSAFIGGSSFPLLS